MPTIVITGAASGIGAAFLAHYASDASNSLIALDRSPILRLPTYAARLTTHILDITSEPALASLSQELKDVPIDLLIHSAGVRGLVPSIVQSDPGDTTRAETIETMDAETMRTAFEINTLGTFMLIRTLLPNLCSAAVPKVVVMSSRMGSISYNSIGAGYAYRASKAALNAVVKSFSIDVPEVIFALVHPGRVETGLVEWKEDGAIRAGESVRDMLDLIGGWGREDSRLFVDRWGKEIGW
ncbi:C-factor [Glonium stellatum]|uniref:C-factor n=1 Tax=Glonium stellatum TaxID=574774 RepID=A0A8E2FDR3_9PEZI|nr:C-factor [Glonium stellatum]